MISKFRNFNTYGNSGSINNPQKQSEIVSGISIHIEIQDITFQKSRSTLFLLELNKYLKYLFIFHFSFSSLFSRKGKEGDLS